MTKTRHLPEWYIVQFAYNAIESSITMVLARNPDRPAEKIQTVEIAGVSKLSVDRYHDPADVCMGNLETVTCNRQGELWRTRIDTGDAIVEFDALTKTEI